MEKTLESKIEASIQQGGSAGMLQQKEGAVRASLYNPLPLPKKKEHKALDFDYEVSDDDDYDI